MRQEGISNNQKKGNGRRLSLLYNIKTFSRAPGENLATRFSIKKNNNRNRNPKSKSLEEEAAQNAGN